MKVALTNVAVSSSEIMNVRTFGAFSTRERNSAISSAVRGG